MPKYIVSQPAIARCMESRSSRSPTMTSAPISRSARDRWSSLRTIARTALPCFNSSSVTVRPTPPTRPAAPVTRIGVPMFVLLCEGFQFARYGLQIFTWPVPMMIASKRFIAVSGAFDVELARFRCFFRCLPVLARYDVGGVPTRPVVLRSRRFVLAMMLLCLAQKLCQRRDVQGAESSSGQPRGDFLKQPGVAVGVVECGKGKVAAVIGCHPADATVAVGPELGPGS